MRTCARCKSYIPESRLEVLPDTQVCVSGSTSRRDCGIYVLHRAHVRIIFSGKVTEIIYVDMWCLSSHINQIPFFRISISYSAFSRERKAPRIPGSSVIRGWASSSISEFFVLNVERGRAPPSL